jgi:hypothetical protein
MECLPRSGSVRPAAAVPSTGGSAGGLGMGVAVLASVRRGLARPPAHPGCRADTHPGCRGQARADLGASRRDTRRTARRLSPHLAAAALVALARRTLGLLTIAGLLAIGPGILLFGAPEGSPLRLLSFVMPALLILVLIARHEAPSLKITPLPRPLPADAWTPIPETPATTARPTAKVSVGRADRPPGRRAPARSGWPPAWSRLEWPLWDP